MLISLLIILFFLSTVIETWIDHGAAWAVLLMAVTAVVTAVGAYIDHRRTRDQA